MVAGEEVPEARRKKNRNTECAATSRSSQSEEIPRLRRELANHERPERKEGTQEARGRGTQPLPDGTGKATQGTIPPLQLGPHPEAVVLLER
jgi:hypothetical protein